MIPNRITANQPVTVRADFESGTIRPLFFKTGRRSLKIARVMDEWTEREDGRTKFYFAVSSPGGEAFQLKFDSAEMVWYAASGQGRCAGRA